MTDRVETRREVQWRDLLHLTPTEVVLELVITLPWLLLTLGAWHLADSVHPAFGILALAAAFMLFLTGLRQAHGAFHYSLGLSRPMTEVVMYLLSVLMLSSMHAVQVTHLNHHRHCLNEEDVEGAVAHLPAWKVFVLGPYFTYSIHRHGCRLAGPVRKRRIVVEAIMIAMWIACVFVLFDSFVLEAHVIAMGVAQTLTGFFAVWTVHRGCDGRDVVARTQRGRLKNLISYGMLRHVEHHLYPSVPQPHLDALSRRLDEEVPGLDELCVY